MLGIFFSHSLPDFLEMGSLSEPGVQRFSRIVCPTGAKHPPISASSAQDYEPSQAGSYMDWRSKLRPSCMPGKHLSTPAIS